MFVAGMAERLWAQSSGLMADALDMLTDATAYGLGLMAVTRGTRFNQYSAHCYGLKLAGPICRVHMQKRQGCYAKSESINSGCS
jgi:Co/Zn/Cd efflux system component